MAGRRSTSYTTRDAELSALNSIAASAETNAKNTAEIVKEIANLRGEVAACQSEVQGFRNNMRNDMKVVCEGVVNIKTQVEAIATRKQYIDMQADSGNSNVSVEVQRANCAVAICKYEVATALLGKNVPSFTYLSQEDTELLAKDAVQFAFGKKPAEQSDDDRYNEIRRFLNYLSLAGRTGITKVFTEVDDIPGYILKDARTVKERICTQRRRVHETIVPRIINAWMRVAPGFEKYRSSISARKQPKEVLNAAKEALRKVQCKDVAAYLADDKYLVAFEDACFELLRSASCIVLSALGEMSKHLDDERLSRMLEDAAKYDEALGKIEREPYEYEETDGLFPHQLAFVVVKVGAKLEDLVLFGEQRPKRALELGHARHFMSEAIQVSDEYEAIKDARQENHDINNAPIVEDVYIHGVLIRGKLPGFEKAFFQSILDGKEPNSSMRRRFNEDDLEGDGVEKSFGSRTLRIN